MFILDYPTSIKRVWLIKLSKINKVPLQRSKRKIFIAAGNLLIYLA